LHTIFYKVYILPKIKAIDEVPLRVMKDIPSPSQVTPEGRPYNILYTDDNIESTNLINSKPEIITTSALQNFSNQSKNLWFQNTSNCKYNLRSTRTPTAKPYLIVNLSDIKLYMNYIYTY